jgi:predicted transposase/invertase (TIGR01784 family)
VDIINNPHDKYFKQVMGNVETAKSFLENYLPSKVVEMIDLSTLEPEKDSFIEKKLRDIYSDLLFKARINNKDGYLYFLFEHKSYVEKRIAIQLLKYIISIWEQKIYKEKKEKLPVVIPVVVHHGRSKWNEDTTLGSQIEDYDNLPDYIKKYIPDFMYNLYDF